jgi:glutaredoxin-like protein NrdH
MAHGKMETVKVPGKNNKHKVLMYAISTCAWCKLTKQFLRDNNIEYEYVDVDLCSEKDREKVRRDIQKRGGDLNYPTIIIDDKVLITGFRKDKIREALKI